MNTKSRVKQHRQAVCRRKTAYTKKEAEARVLLKYFQTGRGGYAYNCDVCGWYHITKMAKEAPRGLR